MHAETRRAPKSALPETDMRSLPIAGAPEEAANERGAALAPDADALVPLRNRQEHWGLSPDAPSLAAPFADHRRACALHLFDLVREFGVVPLPEPGPNGEPWPTPMGLRPDGLALLAQALRAGRR